MKRAMQIFLATMITMLASLPVSADWARNLTTDPSLESPVPVVPTSVSNGSTEYYFWIDDTSISDSRWMFLPKGVHIDFCFDSDVDSPTPGAGTTTVEMMFIPGATYGKPSGVTDHDAQAPLLGAILDGVPSESGTPNDCLRNITGPLYFKTNVLTAGTGADALVTITVK